MFRNMIRFYGEEFLAPRPTPKLEDHPLSTVRDDDSNNNNNNNNSNAPPIAVIKAEQENV